MAEKKFGGEGQGASVVDHLKQDTRRGKALDVLDFYLELNERNMHAEHVTRDVLILSGRKDHFMPFKMHTMQIQALSIARSVTARVFTRAEYAENHYESGDMGLAFEVMICSPRPC